MRISTSQWYAQSLGSMLSQQKSLTETQLQLASGKRILRPSDDPVAATRGLDVSRTLGKLEQYGRNASQVQGRLMQEETALTSSLNLLQRAREITLMANSAAQSDESRGALAREVRELHGTMRQLVNSRDGSGNYVFGGITENLPPYDESGLPTSGAGTGQRQIQIGVNSFVLDTDPASTVFVYSYDGDDQDVLAHLDALAIRLAQPGATTLAMDMASALNLIDADIAQLSDARTTIGARLSQLDMQAEIRADSSLQLSGTLSDLEDLDYAETLSRFSQQLTGLQAAQQVFGKVQGLSLFNYLR